MERGAVLTAGVVCVVLLAGCAGFGTGSGSDPASTEAAPTATEQPTTESTTAQPTAETTTAQPAAGTTTQSATGTTTQPTTEEWSSPEHPNKPLENKLTQGVANHVKDVEVVGGEESGDGAYSSVEIAVTANTSFRRIDPAEHGTVDGEPFFIVYVDSSLENDSQGPRFYRVDGPPIERSSEVGLEENGTFTLTVPQAGFEAAGAEAGETELLVVLFDEDKSWDDIYGVGTVNVTYAPGE